MELGWGGFDRAKLDMLILIRLPFSFHVVTYHRQAVSNICAITCGTSSTVMYICGRGTYCISQCTIHFFSPCVCGIQLKFVPTLHVTSLHCMWVLQCVCM